MHSEKNQITKYKIQKYVEVTNIKVKVEKKYKLNFEICILYKFMKTQFLRLFLEIIHLKTFFSIHIFDNT